MPRLRALCLMLLYCCVAPAWAARPLTVMVEDAAGPWSNADGTGMANDLVKAAFAAAGQPVELDVVPYARCKAGVLKGQVAACFSMSDAPELKGAVSLAEQPLFNVYPRFYMRGSSAAKPDSEADIAPGARVGIVNGYEYPAAVAALAARGVKLDASRSDLVNLKKLAAGHLDFALIMTDALKTDAMLIRQAGVTDVTFAFQSTPMGSFIGFSTRHHSGRDAQRQFNRGYARISKNGVKRQIEDKWRRLCASGCD